MSTNQYLAQQAAGIENQIDFSTPTTNKGKVRALRDMISNEEMDQSSLRMFLDKMDPNARIGLYVALTALEAAVVEPE
jgi:hypothetical protein